MQEKQTQGSGVAPFIQSPVKLTISLLVSNRIATIRRCLDSVRPLLAQIPSELIVVDTVGEERSDGSLAVAREYTDHIVHFDWCDDFAAARNAGQAQARGEWFLYLDDDEWFEDVSPIVAFLRQDDGRTHSCFFPIRNYLDREGHTHQDAIVGRLVRRTANTRFQRKIHEYLDDMRGPNTRLDCLLHHDGYAFASQAERLAHSRRNILPLQEYLRENPDDLRTACQLAREYLAIEEYERAEELCRRVMDEGWGEDAYPPYVGLLASCYVNALYHRGDWAALRQATARLLANPHLIELAKADICLRLQRVEEGVLGDEEMLRCIDQYFAQVDALDADEARYLEQIVTALDGCQSDQNRKAAMLRGLRLCAALGHWPRAWGYAQRIASHAAEPEPLLLAAMADMVRAGAETKQFDRLCALLAPRLGSDAVLQALLGAADAPLAQADDERRGTMLRALAALPGPGRPQVIVQRLRLADWQGRVADLQPLVEEYARADVRHVPAQGLLRVALRRQLDLTPLVGQLALETWESTVQSLFAGADAGERDALAGYLGRFWGEGSPEELCLRAERLLSTLRDEATEPTAFRVAFEEYQAAECAYQSRLYPPEQFSEEGSSSLPSRARAAFSLGEALRHGRQGQTALQVRCLRQALRSREDLAAPIRRYTALLEQAAAQPPSPQSELAALSRKIKGSIDVLIGQGQWQQARATLDQLRLITPGDPELEEYYNKLK